MKEASSGAPGEGLSSLNHLTTDYAKYYHTQRPHQEIENRLSAGPALPPDSPPRADQLICQ
ncbi:MAG: hypothetical protein ACK5Q5_14970, partial [Planctomycetaceae bacterium]